MLFFNAILVGAAAYVAVFHGRDLLIGWGHVLRGTKAPIPGDRP